MAYDRYDRDGAGASDAAILRRPRPRAWDRGDDRDRDLRPQPAKIAASSSARATRSRSWFGDEDARARPRHRPGPRRGLGRPPAALPLRRAGPLAGLEPATTSDYRAAGPARSASATIVRSPATMAARAAATSRTATRNGAATPIAGPASQARARARTLHDPHYQEWRQRQIDELDRDYDDYRREHQSNFESDFGNWRQRRQTKRQMLGDIREHMEVVGSDDEHVGTVDRVAGDRIILTKQRSASPAARTIR